MRGGRSAGRCFRLKLFDQPAEPILLRLCHDQKLDADALGPAPSDRGILDHDGVAFSGDVQEKGDLHAGEGADQALDPTAFRGEIANRSLVAKLVLDRKSVV